MVLFDFGIYTLFQFFEISGKKLVKALLLGFAACKNGPEAVLKAFIIAKSIQLQECLECQGLLGRANDKTLFAQESAEGYQMGA
jgi:hypothetical protein